MSFPNSTGLPEAVPAAVSQIAEVMSGFPAHWCLCGGWAVDAWLGRQTREHGDIDISVFEDGQRALLGHFEGWHLIAHDEVEPDADQAWDGRKLALPAHIHASRDRDSVLAWVTEPKAPVEGTTVRLEIVIDARSENEWLLKPDPRVALPLRQAIGQTAWGVPAAAPEVLLFFKATAYFGQGGQWKRPRDDADFESLLPVLEPAQRAWLQSAIVQEIPAHPWLEALSG